MAKKAKSSKAKKVAKKVAKKPANKSVKKTIKQTAKKQVAVKAPKVKAATDWQKYLSPLYDKVLLKKETQEIISKAGLYLGTVTDAAYSKAEVLAVGKGLLSKKGRIRPLDVQEGDTVLFSSYAGNTMKVDGMDVVIVKEEEILGILEK